MYALVFLAAYYVVLYNIWAASLIVKKKNGSKQMRLKSKNTENESWHWIFMVTPEIAVVVLIIIIID